MRSGTGWRCVPPDVNLSAATRCSIEGRGGARSASAYIRGLGESSRAKALVAERKHERRRSPSVRELAQRAPLDRPGLEALVASGACDSFGWPRRQLLWRLGLAPRSVSVGAGGGGAPARASARPDSRRSRAPGADAVGADARRLPHDEPLGRRPPARAAPPAPARRRCSSSAELEQLGHGARVAVAGLVVARQRPSTAKGVVFMLLEDEHGQVNLIVPAAGVRALPARSCAASRSSSRAAASSASSGTGTSSWTRS